MQRLRGIDAQKANIQAAKAVARILRSSLGPKGMDKMLQSGDGDVCISRSPPVVPSSSRLEAAALIALHHGLCLPLHNSSGVLTASAQSVEHTGIQGDEHRSWARFGLFAARKVSCSSVCLSPELCCSVPRLCALHCPWH